jgi:methoxymalonate biosynthesis acyl carrier protein
MRFMDTTQSRIRSFLSRYCRNRDLQDDDNIFALGFVSSVVAMQLVLFVEKEFSVKIENEDLDLKNFSSIAAISGLVARKKAASV